MKKLFAIAVLAGLALTGCSKSASNAEPVAAASAAAEQTILLPDVVGLTLDKANDQLEDIGLKVKAKDVNDDKAIIAKKNWEVVSQDPGKATSAAKGSTVQLGVRHLTDATASPSPTATTAPAPLVAPPAVETPAAVAPAAPAPPAAEPAPAQVQPAPAPAAPYYKNCDAVRAAGAAPIHSSQPGYGRHLDRDGDGWGCDK